jgi:oligosaccharide amylase
MPKHLVLSNGNLLIGLDRRGQVWDIYYPYVGLENQTGGHYYHRLGVWSDGKFSWFDDPAWNININYESETLVGQITATNDYLGLKIEITDVVYNEKDIYIRQFNVSNITSSPKLVKLFFHHQLEIHESHLKDTSFFDPNHNCVIHYKGRRAFLFSAQCEGVFFEDYTTGLFGIEGHEGSHIDAQDGTLSKNPIEHGQVDSVIGISLNIDPNSTKLVHYWVAAANSVQGLYDLNQYILDKTPQYLMKSSQNFWHAWVNRQNINFADLSPRIVELFKKSQLIVRTHADNHGGIIASCDSDLLKYGRDNYSYVWGRDGALSAISLDKTGDHAVAERFFMFCNSVIHPDGYFLHKYRPDLALGSSWHPWVRNGTPQLPIQEDETALVIYALWQHYLLTRDLEFIETIYNSLIKRSAEFMVSYRDPKTGLPQPSYNLWEEKFGINTFTSSTVYAALNSAASFADLLGKTESSKKYRKAAGEVQDAILKNLYDANEGYFYCVINKDGQEGVIDKTIDFSSVYGIFKFGVLPPDDNRLTRALSYTLYRLGLTTLVGGVARYEGDPYFRADYNLPGNPWFITTLWLAQYYLTQVKQVEDLASVKRLLEWVVKHTLPSGILSEQLNPHTGEQLSAAPLTWSHAEFITTVLDYLDKLKQLQAS